MVLNIHINKIPINKDIRETQFGLTQQQHLMDQNKNTLDTLAKSGLDPKEVARIGSITGPKQQAEELSNVSGRIKQNKAANIPILGGVFGPKLTVTPNQTTTPSNITTKSGSKYQIEVH